MAEIENKRTLTEGSKNRIDRTIHGRTAGKQSQRIEVALNGTPLLYHRPREFKLDRPIEPDCIDRNRVQIATELGAGAARKSDDARSRKFRAHLFDDSD